MWSLRTPSFQVSKRGQKVAKNIYNKNKSSSSRAIVIVELFLFLLLLGISVEKE